MFGLLKKDYIYFRLEKNDTLALQNGLISYIKTVYYYYFFPTHIIQNLAY